MWLYKKILLSMYHYFFFIRISEKQMTALEKVTHKELEAS